MNHKKIVRFTACFLFLTSCFFSLPPAHAAVPKLMSYQGVLKDSSSNLLTGTYSMTFRIYSASTGGTSLWTETQSSVSASSGKFSVQLGGVTALNLDFNADYWLSVQVGTDAEMSPRVRLTSVGYGFRADYEVNGFTQSQHDSLSHKNIEGVKDNTVNLAKTNFKLDAYSVAAANSLGDLIVDTFNDASGIASSLSSGYTWRTSPNYDVIVAAGGGIDANTVLMLHMNGTDASTTFTDSGNGGKSMTANGNAQIDTAQSKFAGASGLFDGDGDYVSAADHSDFAFGTGDFTIDFWVRLNSTTGEQCFVCKPYSGQTGLQFESNGGTELAFQFNDGTNGISLTPAWTPSTGIWYHIAATRSGNTFRLFVDGAQVGTVTDVDPITTDSNTLTIGSKGAAKYLNGWLDEVRLVKGSAVWTSNFTPPSGEYTSSPGSATVISTAFTEPSAPTEAIVVADETLGTGSITYYVSRDNGTTWTQCAKETTTNISVQPSGTQLRWKAVISGNAELNSVAVAV